MSIKHTAQKKSATNKTLILNTNTHFIRTQKGCLQWFFVQDCACNTRKGPFLLFTVQIMGALVEEGGTLKNKSVSGNVLLGAIFRVCYCFDHTTHFPAAGYGGRQADLWRWKWAQEKYGLETQMLFLHENYLQLESCQAAGVLPELTWHQPPTPPINGNPIWLGNYQN